MSEESIMPPAFAAKQFIQQNNLRPHLLVHPNVLPDFEDLEKDDPTCVVLGDAVELFNYQNINTVFRLIKEKNCELISLGKGKYYREDGALTLDVGAFTAGLEFACGREAVVCGKPDKQFFKKAGIRGVLVRTGKYTPADEHNPHVKPNLIVDNLKALADAILAHNQAVSSQQKELW
jgi:phospholysine phosphohistidine inorganic pyrophosphate phosphatase